MSALDAAFAVVVGEEGGYGADPRDPGNWTGGQVGAGVLRGTKFGISAAAYPTLDIEALTLADAQAIYRRDYWDRVAGDDLPPPVALLTFDAAVNQGPERAARWLQLAAGVDADGIVGPETIAAVHGADVLDVLAGVAWERDCAYHAAPGWTLYGHGWMRRLAQVLALALVYDEPGGAPYLAHAGRVA